MRGSSGEVSYLSADQISQALGVKIAEIGLHKRMEMSEKLDEMSTEVKAGKARKKISRMKLFLRGSLNYSRLLDYFLKHA